MKSFRQICLDSRNTSSQRNSLSSLNASKRSSSLTQSFRSILNKQGQLQGANKCKKNSSAIETDTQLFTKLLKVSKQNNIDNNIQYRTQTQPFAKPSIKSIKKKIKINRRLMINPNVHTPIRDMKQRIKQEKTTAVELTSTQKKQIESDLSRVTKKIKQRLTQKQLNQQNNIESQIQQAQKDIKGETQKAFEKVLKKRNCILSSIKSKKNNNSSEDECKISTPRFDETNQEVGGNTDRFQNSLLHTIEEVLNKISIQPILTQPQKDFSQEYSQTNPLSKMSFNMNRFSTKSIKNRLTQPYSSSNQSSVLD